MFTIRVRKRMLLLLAFLVLLACQDEPRGPRMAGDAHTPKSTGDSLSSQEHAAIPDDERRASWFRLLRFRVEQLNDRRWVYVMAEATVRTFENAVSVPGYPSSVSKVQLDDLKVLEGNLPETSTFFSRATLLARADGGHGYNFPSGELAQVWLAPGDRILLLATAPPKDVHLRPPWRHDEHLFLIERALQLRDNQVFQVTQVTIPPGVPSADQVLETVSGLDTTREMTLLSTNASEAIAEELKTLRAMQD